MTKAERQELASLLALLRGLLRQGSAREALSILESIRARREPHPAIARIAVMLRRAHAEPTPIGPVQVDSRVTCEVLRCDLTAGECVRRQLKTDAQRTQQSTRGQGTDHPSCDTRKCEQGSLLREHLSGEPAIVWRGGGFGGRFDRERLRSDVITQGASRARLERAGLLSTVPTVDGINQDEEV